MGRVRRLGALTLLVVVAAIVGFAAYYGFVHRPNDEDRTVQVLYAATLLIPPALFLTLALILLLRRTAGTNVLALIGIAVLVGTPTLVYFLGGLIGISLMVAILIVIGAASAALMRRSTASWPSSHIGPS
jgi:Na+/melibiose symporter-like transporter